MKISEILKEDELDKRGEMCSVCTGGRREGYGDCPNCGGEGYIEKEELEEIKVTKTLAGKRTKPSRDLAMKTKMKKKKKDSKGKEVKDATTPMNRNVHDLANITLKGEYRS